MKVLTLKVEDQLILVVQRPDEKKSNWLDGKTSTTSDIYVVLYNVCEDKIQTTLIQKGEISDPRKDISQKGQKT